MNPETLRETLRNITWDHAVRLGVPGHATAPEGSPGTDPEAMTVLAGLHDEPRLRREWAGWLRTFGDKLNNSRLKKILESLIDFHDDVVSTEVPDSEDNDPPAERIDPETVQNELTPVKSLLQSVEENSDHSFGPALEMMEGLQSETEDIDAGNTKIDHVNESKIVPNVPALFWRHIAGVNTRAELLRAVGTGWSGSNKQASEELYLPFTSVRRARRNLEPTDYVRVEQVGNQKVISRGPGYHTPGDTAADQQFMNWFIWIRVVLKTKPLIESNIDKDLDTSLENRFTRIARDTLEEELLNPTYTHRHGDEASKYLLNRIFAED